MSDSTRRGFMKVAGIGVAGAGAAVVAAKASSADAAPVTTDAASAPRSVKGPIVVHVRDVRRGSMSIMVEGHEVEVTDRDLAARIAGALHTSSRSLDTSAG